MAVLILLLTLICLLACGVVLLPWYRRKQVLKVNQTRQVDLYRAKLAELDADLANGLIEAQAHQSAYDDLKIQLASELNAQANQQQSSQSKKPILMLLPLLTCLSVLAIYQWQGKPAQLNQYFTSQEQAAELGRRLMSGDESFTAQELSNFYLGLRSQLQQKSDDAIGWLLLGRIAYSLGDLDNALASFESSLKIEPNKYGTMMSYAQVMIATNAPEYLKKALNVYGQVLTEHPEDAEALTMAGYVAFELKAKVLAMQYWDKALQVLPANDMRRSAIAQSMPDLAKKYSIDVNQNLPASHPQVAQTADTQASATQTQAAKSLVVNLNISDMTKSKLNQFSYLVVFARPQLSGPPAAVARLAISGDLPSSVVLNDQNAMMAGFNLTSLANAYVTVRLSKDADVTLSEGEIEVNSEQIELKDEQTSITLSL